MIRLDYRKHCILYTILDHLWEIKGDTVLYIPIRTRTLHHFGIQHYLPRTALVIRFLNNHALHCLEINDSLLHTKNNYFSVSLCAGFQEIGLKSARFLASVLPMLLHTMQPASPSAG